MGFAKEGCLELEVYSLKFLFGFEKAKSREKKQGKRHGF